ncbi:MAG TPA: hypothetical protein VFC52_07925 [Solirubrobacterales bacterium]|nr:hypothetical protein [Solirubrobacterales bacterium]
MRKLTVPISIFLAILIMAAPAVAAPGQTRIAYGPARIVPIPASIPHEAGDMVDRRIVPDLRRLAKRFPIYVTDGYSGRLPGGGPQVGCRGCHVRGSDHHNGLAVDIVALGGGNRCDRSWRGITRLAGWAEPRQNRPRAPFRWVGYDGDAGHGCGNHLHLSWEHSTVRQFQIAQWVETLRVGRRPVAPPQKPSTPPSGLKPPEGPPGGAETEPVDSADAPQGGISASRSGGGVSVRGD